MPKPPRAGVFYGKDYMLNYRAIDERIARQIKGVSVKFYFSCVFVLPLTYQ
jgi:hypothetical protein